MGDWICWNCGDVGLAANDFCSSCYFAWKESEEALAEAVKQQSKGAAEKEQTVKKQSTAAAEKEQTEKPQKRIRCRAA